MKTIETSVGSRKALAKVDDEDYARLTKINWAYYVSSKGMVGKQSNKNVSMHRIVAGAVPGEIVRFRNGDEFDCRRSNLVLIDPKTKKELALRLPDDDVVHQQVQTPEPTYKVTEYVNIEKPILVAPTPQPKFIDLTGKGHQVMGVDEIAWFELDDPAKAVVVLRKQMFDTHGGGARNVEFEYTGDEAQNVRLQALRLTDQSGEKMITFCVDLINENKKQAAHIDNQAASYFELCKEHAKLQVSFNEAINELSDDSEKKQLEKDVKKLQAQVYALNNDRDRLKSDMDAAAHGYVKKEMAFAQEFIEVQAKYQRLVDKLRGIGFDVDTLMKS